MPRLLFQQMLLSHSKCRLSKNHRRRKMRERPFKDRRIRDSGKYRKQQKEGF
jgi:hypothetical protein